MLLLLILWRDVVILRVYSRFNKIWSFFGFFFVFFFSKKKMLHLFGIVFLINDLTNCKWKVKEKKRKTTKLLLFRNKIRTILNGRTLFYLVELLSIIVFFSYCCALMVNRLNDGGILKYNVTSIESKLNVFSILCVCVCRKQICKLKSLLIEKKYYAHKKQFANEYVHTRCERMLEKHGYQHQNILNLFHSLCLAISLSSFCTLLFCSL